MKASRSRCMSTKAQYLPYGNRLKVTRSIFLLSVLTRALVLEFIAANPELVDPDNAMAFLSDDNGETYNKCHCKLLVNGLGKDTEHIISLEQLRNRRP